MKNLSGSKSIIVIAALSSGLAFAQSPSFDFVEAGVTETFDESGFIIRGNTTLDKNWFLAGSYETVDLGIVDANILIAGVGYKVDIDNSSSFYGQVSLLRLEADSSFGNTSEDGYQLGVGYRSQLTEATQLYAEVNHQNVDSNSLTLLSAGLRYQLSDQFALFAEVKQDDFDNDGYAIGVNYSF